MKQKYDGIRYPFHKLKDGVSVLDVYPELGNVEIFRLTEMDFPVRTDEGDRIEHVTLGELDNEFVMRYIILMYSKGSPAIEGYPQIGKRKSWVMEQFGVRPNEKNEFPDKYRPLLLNKNKLINRKIACFLTLQQPADWGIMLRYQEELQAMLELPSFDNPSDQKNKIQAVELIRDHIEKAKSRIREVETSRVIEDEIETFMAYTTLGIRPEELVMLNLKPVLPSKAKADTLFPEAGN